jgi:hypothetical protein
LTKFDAVIVYILNQQRNLATQFAEAHGFRMDKTLLKDSAAYVRDALVKASDGQYSDRDYLVKIFEDAIRRG